VGEVDRRLAKLLSHAAGVDLRTAERFLRGEQPRAGRVAESLAGAFDAAVSGMTS
jgi:hypothetical protein